LDFSSAHTDARGTFFPLVFTGCQLNVRVSITTIIGVEES